MAADTWLFAARKGEKEAEMYKDILLGEKYVHTIFDSTRIVTRRVIDSCYGVKDISLRFDRLLESPRLVKRLCVVVQYVLVVGN